MPCRGRLRWRSEGHWRSPTRAVLARHRRWPGRARPSCRSDRAGIRPAPELRSRRSRVPGRIHPEWATCRARHSSRRRWSTSRIRHRIRARAGPRLAWSRRRRCGCWDSPSDARSGPRRPSRSGRWWRWRSDRHSRWHGWSRSADRREGWRQPYHSRRRPGIRFRRWFQGSTPCGRSSTSRSPGSRASHCCRRTQDCRRTNRGPHRA